ncbi:ABC transporter substrate-binding protein, partial [Planctomycetaceae bacterium]|nr:ABC transporter substrate-binding protein [Planctomycetaceae bacterium]
QPRVLMVSDLGFNPYTSVLITTPEVIRTRPELVAKMVKASVSGWLKYLDDPSQTNQAISDRNEDMGLPILAFGARELKTLCVTPETPRTKLGRMTAARWKTLLGQLVDVEAIEDGKVDVSKVFTNRFLDEP